MTVPNPAGYGLPLLDVGMSIKAPSGFIDLMAPPYDLGSDTLAEVSNTWRKKEVTNPAVEGTYLVHAERENVVESVSVYIFDPDPRVVRSAISALEAAFSQLYYTMTFRLGSDTATWTCETADYTVDRHREFAHNGLALVKARVPRLPQVTYS